VFNKSVCSDRENHKTDPSLRGSRNTALKEVALRRKYFKETIFLFAFIFSLSGILY
jgi:hypothetical protein